MISWAAFYSAPNHAGADGGADRELFVYRWASKHCSALVSRAEIDLRVCF
jgi:hypothetical protein